MRGDDKPEPTISVGDRVRLKPGATDIAYDNMILEGWTGTVCDLSDEMCCVLWNEETQRMMPEAYRERWRGDGLPLDSLWVPRASVEPVRSDADTKSVR
jgi:hypothetical protein